MDDQLPILKDFKPIEADPQKPEPWWKRYYSYFFTAILSSLLFGIFEFLRETRLLKDKYRIGRPSNDEIFEYTIYATLLGLFIGILIGYSAEKSRKK